MTIELSLCDFEGFMQKIDFVHSNDCLSVASTRTCLDRAHRQTHYVHTNCFHPVFPEKLLPPPPLQFREALWNVRDGGGGGGVTKRCAFVSVHESYTQTHTHTQTAWFTVEVNGNCGC